MTAEMWDSYYQADPPPYWNIGKPQPALSPLIPNAQSDTIDVGCGIGALTLAVASQGVTTYGLDVSDVAISQASAADTGNLVTWITSDIMALTGFDDHFATIFDSGLFNTIGMSNISPSDYVAKITSIAKQGAKWYGLVYDETWNGPTEDQLRGALAGWSVDDVSHSTIMVNETAQQPWGFPLMQVTEGGFLIPAYLFTATKE